VKVWQTKNDKICHSQSYIKEILGCSSDRRKMFSGSKSAMWRENEEANIAVNMGVNLNASWLHRAMMIVHGM
jgi:hypothetical protein